MIADNGPTKRFCILLIKPSHYDDDGYPIQWLRSAIPSNTLACLNALAEDAMEGVAAFLEKRAPDWKGR